MHTNNIKSLCDSAERQVQGVGQGFQEGVRKLRNYYQSYGFFTTLMMLADRFLLYLFGSLLFAAISAVAAFVVIYPWFLSWKAGLAINLWFVVIAAIIVWKQKDQ